MMFDIKVCKKCSWFYIHEDQSDCWGCDNSSNFSPLTTERDFKASEEFDDFSKKLKERAVARKAKPMTNGDKIRAMNDDELADFLCNNTKCEVCRFGNWTGCKLREWLKQPVGGRL